MAAAAPHPALGSRTAQSHSRHPPFHPTYPFLHPCPAQTPAPHPSRWALASEALTNTSHPFLALAPSLGCPFGAVCLHPPQGVGCPSSCQERG